MQMNIPTLRIVARKSRLAIQQAEIVKNLLLTIYPELNISISSITTSGDQILDQPLNKIGGKGLFVKELETHLLQNKYDIAVHSMKDMPAALPAGLALGAILQRADPRDVLVSPAKYDLSQLPAGSIVGTSSLRRQAQILSLRPDLRVKDLRGNVETRLNKLVAGDYSAIVLAMAGLERLGLNQWLSCPLTLDTMLPAAGQGALGIEYRIADANIAQLIAPLNHSITATCVYAERAMISKLGASCQAPVGGLASIKDNILTVNGLVGSANGKYIFTAQHSGRPTDAVSIGEQVAAQLLAQGAGEFIHA